NGPDRVTGGKGNDTFINVSEAVSVSELPNGGTDTIIETFRTFIDLGPRAYIENAELRTPGVGDLFGNALNNRLTGNDNDNELTGSDGNDTLVGGKGIDTMLGGAGDDTYFVERSGD